MKFTVDGVEFNGLLTSRLETITRVKAFLDSLKDGELLSTNAVRDRIAPGDEHIKRFLGDRKWNQLLDHSHKKGARTIWGSKRSILELRQKVADGAI